MKTSCLVFVMAVAVTALPSPAGIRPGYGGQAAQAPPAAVPPGGDERRELERKLTELAVRVKALAARKADPALVADVDVYDAFMDAFLCVRPTGTAWNPVAQEWVAKTLDVFTWNFAKWLRGDVRVKDDRSVSAGDIADDNLILFGDPGSNSVMARVIGKLPIRWTKSEIEIGTRTFSAADHVPVLIYPNPLNPKRDVVINSGHTFGDEDFRGTNAWLYPRLGDYSVVKANGDVALSGFFDEQWRFT